MKDLDKTSVSCLLMCKSENIIVISAQSYGPPRKSENRAIFKYFIAVLTQALKKKKDCLPLRNNIHSAK